MMPNMEELYTLYLQGKCSAEQAEQLVGYFADQSKQRELDMLEMVDRQLNKEIDADALSDYVQTVSREQFSHIQAQISKEEVPVRRVNVFHWWKVAAALLLISSISYLFYTSSMRDTIHSIGSERGPTSTGGGQEVLLTLADGEQISLEDQQKTGSADLSVHRDKDGNLVYTVRSTVAEQAQPSIQRITTPRGKTCHIILSDGTKVWLNAASTLTYDANFVGSSRLTQLEGEGYFEVKSRAHQPFKVQSEGQLVEVLGTHFNISAYANNSRFKTTLLEGRVRLTTTGDSPILLQPGQHAVWDREQSKLEVEEVDDRSSIAWINNEFAFKNAGITEIMNALANWYNIKVTYRSEIKPLGFTGVISKYKSLEEVLEILERTKLINFQIMGTADTDKERSVIVMM
jgi:transmembrane sensor